MRRGGVGKKTPKKETYFSKYFVMSMKLFSFILIATGEFRAGAKRCPEKNWKNFNNKKMIYYCETSLLNRYYSLHYE